MIKLNVWLATTSEQVVKAGELVIAEPDGQGRLIGQFRYTPEYLALPGGFALDPVHLPLAPNIYDANRPQSGVHGVFEDSLPDDWGRKLLVRKFRLGRNQQRVPHLLRVIAGNVMGALQYGESDSAPVIPVVVESGQIERLEYLARQFEMDPLAVEDDMALLFQAASSPGGARPKALVQDNGRAYLAKFSSTKDIFDVVSLEAAAMTLAERAGLSVAKVRCLPCGSRKVLLVERFDVELPTQRRFHCISMQSLLGAEGFYNLSYADMALVVRRISSDPAGDQRQLFRQMVFNVLIGNTDDHLKNFSMLYDGNGWRLSPAYDLVPNIGQNAEHVLRIGADNYMPDRMTLFREAKLFGYKQVKNVEEELAAIIDAVANWREVFKVFDVPGQDVERIGKDIERRLALVRSAGK